MGAEKDLKFMPRPYGDDCATGTGPERDPRYLLGASERGPPCLLRSCSGRAQACSGSAQGCSPSAQVKVIAGQVGGRNWN